MVGFVPDVNPKLLGNAPLRYIAGRTLRLDGKDIPPGSPVSEEQIQSLGKIKVETLLSTRHLKLVPLKEILPARKDTQVPQPVVNTAAKPAGKSAVAPTKSKAALKAAAALKAKSGSKTGPSKHA